MFMVLFVIFIAYFSETTIRHNGTGMKLSKYDYGVAKGKGSTIKQMSWFR